ncbi:MAG: IDEAL domain-containing protein [archaeon]
MIENKPFMKEWKLSDSESIMQKFYKDLDDAIEQRNKEMFYKLSKIITRRIIPE